MNLFYYTIPVCTLQPQSKIQLSLIRIWKKMLLCFLQYCNQDAAQRITGYNLPDRDGKNGKQKRKLINIMKHPPIINPFTAMGGIGTSHLLGIR